MKVRIANGYDWGKAVEIQLGKNDIGIPVAFGLTSKEAIVLAKKLIRLAKMIQ